MKTFALLFLLGAALTGQAVELSPVRALLSIPSVSRDVAACDRAIEWMKAHLERHGVWCVVETLPADGRKILYAATQPGLESPDYVLVTHLDVVAAASPEQFVPVEKEGRLYARGACDTKVNAFCGAEALIRLNGRASVACVFASDEEIGGSTTRHVVSCGHAKPQKAVIVLDAGGKSEDIAYSCKGNAYYKVTATGTSGHSSRPDLCVNPHYLLAEAMLKIRDAYPHQKPGEWGNCASVTIICGGDSQNRIPESAAMTVNVRFTEENGLEIERERIERITGLKTEFIRGTPAASCDPESPELKRIQACVRRFYPARSANLVRGVAANDMRYFPQFGKPLCTLAMNHDGGHSAEEWCEIADIDHFTDLLVSICQDGRGEESVAVRRTFDVSDYGARADGSCATAAFRKAIKACAAAGGGRVTVPAGTYFTGPIHLMSNVDFHLDEGAVLDFSDEPADYLPAVPSSWEGLECWNYSPLVYAYGCTNVALTGKGLLRPRMAKWKAIMDESKTDIASARALLYKWGSEDYPVEKRVMPQACTAVMRPQLVQFNRSKDVLIEDIRIKESPFWTIHLFLCENVTVRNVEVDAHGFNNDAIDIEMTRNVLVDGGTFTAGDDGFVFKAGRNRDAWRLGVPTENVLVRNAHVKFAHSLLCVGSEMSAGVRNVRVENCRVDSCHRFFYVKTNARRGGFIENIELDGVKAAKVDQVLKVDTDVLYQWRALPTYEERITKISNLTMTNVEVGEARNAVVLSGDARSPIDGVTLRNVSVKRVTEEPVRTANAHNVDVSGLRIGAASDSADGTLRE